MAELIWDGKYDENGKRVAPLRVELPFQTVETVNESAQQRQKMLDLFATQRDPEWRNRLIWGDKKYVLPSLLPEFAGKVDLIYIDPPFATGSDFSFQAQVGDESFEKQASIIEQKAYRDTWGRGLDGYLGWFYETSVFLFELLSETGSLFVHCDYRTSNQIRMILDDIFGVESFENEIVWCYSIGGKSKERFARKHDTIFWYSKTNKRVFNGADPKVVVERKPNSHMRLRVDETGRQYQEKTDKKSGKVYRYYVDEGKVPEDYWVDIEQLNREDSERVDYATQKPEALLTRIVSACSNEGDLVLDCFCGSGTTAAVAEKLNRRWITCDLGRFAIHTTRKRLLGIEGVKPFVVQNLGKYERQIWQRAEFGENAASVIRQYRHFILDLYHAEPLEGYTWIHGRKGGRMVHVGAVDSPVAAGDVQHIAIEFRKLIGTGKDAPQTAGVDILGWDFALDMNETQKQIASDARLNVRFVRIPREVLEDKAVKQGDIQFFELAALFADVHVVKNEVIIQLKDFIVSRDDVPQEVMQAVKNWYEWIDYWAVDFNYRDDTFHNEWQSYRTRQDRGLQLQVVHPYEQPGTYTILVKVIDILGNDTTRAFEVEVK